MISPQNRKGGRARQGYAARIRVLALCGFLAASFPVQAAWYQVEVLVFQYLQPDTDGEVWFQNPGLPDRGDSVELVPGNAAARPAPDSDSALVPYQILPPDFYRLGGIYQAFRVRHDYRPLLHVAWQQPGQGRDASRTVHLEQLRTGVPARQGTAAYVAPDDIIDGTVRVRIGRFLHVDVDMAFFPENFSAGSSWQGGTGDRANYVRMQVSRKIKLSELHYLDNPLFGIILEVTRLRLDKP